MNLIWGLFVLPWFVYMLGILLGRSETYRRLFISKKSREKNRNLLSGFLYIAHQRLYRKAIYIVAGNLTFGLLLIVSGLLFGIVPLILLLRSSSMIWPKWSDEVHKAILYHKQRKTRHYFIFVLIAESIVFPAFAALGVQAGLIVIGLVMGRRDILLQQRDLLAVLPWLLPVMLGILLAAALCEALLIDVFKDQLLQIFFHKTAEGLEQSSDLSSGVDRGSVQ